MPVAQHSIEFSPVIEYHLILAKISGKSKFLLACYVGRTTLRLGIHVCHEIYCKIKNFQAPLFSVSLTTVQYRVGHILVFWLFPGIK